MVMRFCLLILILSFTLSLTVYAEYQLFVECVENYAAVGESNLKYTCDAGNSFKDKIVNTGNYGHRIYQDSMAWTSDWWTIDVSGLSYYPVYHAYMHDYTVFLGHGAPAYFVFGVTSQAIDGNSYNYVWLVSQGPNGHTWFYPHDNDGDGVYPRWVTIFSCNVLDNENYPSGFTIFDVFYYTFTKQGSSPAYLHGIVSARSELVDWYKRCLICSETPASVNTMNAYADRLISGDPVVDAWFNAVWSENNVKDIFGRIVFQAQPAALYYIVEFKDPQGNVLASYDYSKEGMLDFSNTIYPAPSQLVGPPGTSLIGYYEVYLYG